MQETMAHTGTQVCEMLNTPTGPRVRCGLTKQNIWNIHTLSIEFYMTKEIQLQRTGQNRVLSAIQFSFLVNRN